MYKTKETVIVNNKLFSTANNQHLKWIAALNLLPSLLCIVIFDEVSDLLSSFGVTQFLYFCIIVKQSVIGAFLGRSSWDSFETTDYLSFAIYGYIFPIAFLWLDYLEADFEKLVLPFMAIAYVVPLLHSFFYELLVQKK